MAATTALQKEQICEKMQGMLRWDWKERRRDGTRWSTVERMMMRRLPISQIARIGNRKSGEGSDRKVKVLEKWS